MVLNSFDKSTFSSNIHYESDTEACMRKLGFCISVPVQLLAYFYTLLYSLGNYDARVVSSRTMFDLLEFFALQIKTFLISFQNQAQETSTIQKRNCLPLLAEDDKNCYCLCHFPWHTDDILRVQAPPEQSSYHKLSKDNILPAEQIYFSIQWDTNPLPLSSFQPVRKAGF